jgi:hypothetical protein
VGKWKAALAILLSFLLAACGSNNAPATPPPPITLTAPPDIQIGGLCDDTKTLEGWLEVTAPLTNRFQTEMNAAAAKSKADLFLDVISLAAIRDSVFATTTPDCALDAQLMLSDTMHQVVGALQAYFNGDRPDLGNVITEANAKLDEVISIQADLLNRMNAQFQQQRLITPTA